MFFVQRFGSVHLAAAPAEEIGPELLDGRHLFVREIIITRIDLLQVTDVTEETAGVHEVFVHVVEIPQQHVAPIDKRVKALLRLLAGPHQGGIVAIEFVERTDLVHRAQAREIGHQVVDGQQAG